MLNTEILPIDIAIADRILTRNGFQSEQAMQFICNLSKATREGHLCVKIDEHTPEFPSSIITDCTNRSNIIPNTPLCKNGDSIYFQKNWLDECLFKNNLNRILSDAPAITLDHLPEENGLQKEQQLAIIKSLKNSFTIISGGPGTGKTYTAGLLIKTLWNSLSTEQRSKISIVLAAPTGKAASNLQKSIQNALKNIQDFPPLSAQTLHSLLGNKRGSSLTQLQADLILIDECSMIDANIMSQLFSRVKTGSRLIFLGDPHQLPPVESGALFADMTDMLAENCVELKKCLRSDLINILEFASRVNQGDADSALKLLYQSTSDSGLKYIDQNEVSGSKLKKFILEYASKRFPLPYIKNDSSEQLIDHFNKFRLLSPMRRGFFGVDELNALFLNYFSSKVPYGASFVAPVMITSNDYRLQLFNGETGILMREPSGEEHFFLYSPTGVRKIPGILLPKYEFAYCLSVHKSQGSEFDEVLALFPEGSEVFGREVLYTAATRARKLLEIWGHDETLRQLINRKIKRVSGLS